MKNFTFQSSICCDVFFFGLTLNMVSNTIIKKGWNSYVAIYILITETNLVLQILKKCFGEASLNHLIVLLLPIELIPTITDRGKN